MRNAFGLEAAKPSRPATPTMSTTTMMMITVRSMGSSEVELNVELGRISDFFRGRMCSHAVFALAHLRSKAAIEVLRLEHLANFDLTLFVVRVRAAFDPVDRLVHGLALP